MPVSEEAFLQSLSDLSGQVAIVTGGAAGLGLQTTKYLSQRNCTVYVASRNREKSLMWVRVVAILHILIILRGIAAAEATLPPARGALKFHHLDLSTITGAQRSAAEFRQKEKRLDIVVANGGVSMLNLSELSADGYERMFATNHLGHFVFVNALLDMVKETSTLHGDARIVITSSIGYRSATGLDYAALSTPCPDDGDSVWDVKPAFVRYGNSKLANIYFANELTKRLREDGYDRIYCNSCHP
ncbi:MAG: hypothetical protein Q9220_004174, partial [cf. Caloplaca sp. 1 TL-2023]